MPHFHLDESNPVFVSSSWWLRWTSRDLARWPGSQMETQRSPDGIVLEVIPLRSSKSSIVIHHPSFFRAPSFLQKDGSQGGELRINQLPTKQGSHGVPVSPPHTSLRKPNTSQDFGVTTSGGCFRCGLGEGETGKRGHDGCWMVRRHGSPRYPAPLPPGGELPRKISKC